MMFYTLHKPQNAALDQKHESGFDSIVALPDSVTFWAILLPAPWLLWHRLWVEFGFYILAMILVGALTITTYAPAAGILAGLPGLYLWLEGQNLRRFKLERQGYEMIDVVQANDEKTAFARFIAKRLGKNDTAPREELERLNDLGMPNASLDASVKGLLS